METVTPSSSKYAEFQQACLHEKRINYSGNVLLDSCGGVISLSYTPSDFLSFFIIYLSAVLGFEHRSSQSKN
jgi:hypothetical protein